MRDALQVHGPLSRGAFAVAVLVSLAVLFAPADDVPFAPAGVDKLVHGALFAALALTGRWSGIGRVVLVPVLVLYAAVSEVLQGMIGRDATVGDWIADVVGVLIGILVWQLTARRAAH
ncbi:VanZ family protein [Blastococcus sp. CT_GayMR16]|uniref:VanZ family protein n=1 Tax=Blastococcus sp. CT_GayMR16 TaxID=2559607 RepID=UPI001073BBC1|nr:VanZ family protein [Blastococcus sp. CT_GayMR16]TFV82710.1 VanZ family protein [Blastococcus sp. CT_GayMR16]